MWFNINCCYCGFSNDSEGKESDSNAGDTKDTSSIPGVGRFPGGGMAIRSTLAFFPEKSHGQRSPSWAIVQRVTKIDMTEHTHCCYITHSITKVFSIRLHGFSVGRMFAHTFQWSWAQDNSTILCVYTHTHTHTHTWMHILYIYIHTHTHTHTHTCILTYVCVYVEQIICH